ncbi:general substrate transporter [Fusarium tjaetaba]|uniref:General substrate transporter n=1 Tax=Fusarium tjaetaba TaxID=1567544 RepID=A0A8H5WA51_9HYPO|nr:general substrate transporter [Fusarium tjaetaba]KAF5650823.1 general substrate transporter [Fusarium tjaetaba]
MATSRKAQTGAADPLIQQIADKDRVPWYNKPNLRYLYLMLFPTYFADRPNGEFTGELKGIIAAAYSLGAMLSLPFIGVINDKLGRRWSIFGGSAIMVIGSIMQGFSVNAGMYIAARILLGFGIPACIVSGSSLIGELSYPKERAYLTCFFNVAFYFGQITAAAICFGTNSITGNMAWKIPSWLQMAPSLVQMALIFFIPESPRWLISKDRSEEAYGILAKYHAEGNRDSNFVKAEFAHMQTIIQLEMEHSSKSHMDLIRTAGMRRRTLITAGLGLFTQWSGNTLISYYLNDILEMIGRNSSIFKQQINVALSCWSLVCGVVIVLTCVRLKRVTAAYMCTISMLVIYVAWTVAMERATAAINAGRRNNGAAVAVLFLIFAYKPAYQIFYNALTYTYLVEIWPYAERSRGIALQQFFSRGASFATTFINPIGLENIGWKYFISYCVILALEIAFVYFFFAETSGRTLEELAFLFEDKELAEAANDAAMKASDHARVEEVEMTRDGKAA